MSKKLNAGDAALLVLRVADILAPAKLPVLRVVRGYLNERIAALENGTKAKVEQAPVQP